MNHGQYWSSLGRTRLLIVGGMCLGLLFLMVSWLPAGEPQDQAGASTGRKVKVVLIGHQPDHPPGTHLYLETCELLAQCLRQTPQVEAVVSDGWPSDPAVLAGVSGIVLYSSPGAEILLQGEQREQCETLLKQGVGLASLHWATGIRDQNNEELAERYLSQLGGLFSFGFSGLDISASRVEQLDGSHPICRGWSDFDLTDEYYLNLTFLPQAKPLLRVRVKDEPQTVGWIYERPDSHGGRSYGNTLGHFEELFRQEAFRKMLVNGILWTVHVEIPPDGADCQL